MTSEQIASLLIKYDPMGLGEASYGNAAAQICNFCERYRDPTRELLSRKVSEVLSQKMSGDQAADHVTCNHIARDILQDRSGKTMSDYVFTKYDII
jgi:hypothetical protein